MEKIFVAIFCCAFALSKAQRISGSERFHNLNSVTKEVSNGLCNRQLSYFLDGLDRNVLWAREMRDSWGNVPSGLFSGNVYDFGSFDQCINFRHYSMDVGEISGQHCTLMIPFDLRDSNEQISKFMPPSRR